jgi:hypothetical protein
VILEQAMTAAAVAVAAAWAWDALDGAFPRRGRHDTRLG